MRYTHTSLKNIKCVLVFKKQLYTKHLKRYLSLFFLRHLHVLAGQQ